MTLSQAKIVHEFVRSCIFGIKCSLGHAAECDGEDGAEREESRDKLLEDILRLYRYLYMESTEAKDAMQAAESILQEAQAAAEAGGKR